MIDLAVDNRTSREDFTFLPRPRPYRRDTSEWVDCGQDKIVSQHERRNDTAALRLILIEPPRQVGRSIRLQSATDFLEVLQRLERLETVAEDWRQPHPQAIGRARSWLISLTSEILGAHLLWLRPSIAAGSDSEVEMEWWYEGRSLTVYCSVDETTYIESWGLNIENDMAEGSVESREDRLKLWTRLVG